MPVTIHVPSLRHWRELRKLAQNDLAHLASVHPTSVLRGEAGHPLRLATIRRLATALQVEPSDLMSQPPAE